MRAVSDRFEGLLPHVLTASLTNEIATGTLPSCECLPQQLANARSEQPSLPFNENLSGQPDVP